MTGTKEYDLEQVTTWLAAMQDRGLFNTNTARLRSTAIEQIATILAEDEPRTVSYMLANIEALANRWTTKKNAKPDTAAAYRSRAKIALEEFLAYQANPTGFKGPGKTNGPSTKKAVPADRQSKRDDKQPSPDPTQPLGPVQPYRSYPISSGDFVYRMPEKGISVADVRRLMLHMLTLATDFDPIQHTSFFALAKTEK